MEQYAAAQVIVDSVGGVELEWRVAFGRGQALEQLGREVDATAAYRQAVLVIERTRDQLREERFRSGFLSDKQMVYVALVRLLVKMGRPEDAFHFSERLRARSYARLISTGSPPIRSLEQRRRESELRKRIRQLRRVMAEEQARPAPQQRQVAVSLFSSELLAVSFERASAPDGLEKLDLPFDLEVRASLEKA